MSDMGKIVCFFMGIALTLIVGNLVIWCTAIDTHVGPVICAGVFTLVCVLGTTVFVIEKIKP